MTQEIRIWREAQKLGYDLIEKVMTGKTQEQMSDGITTLRGVAILILAHDFMNIVEHKLGPSDDFHSYASYVAGCIHDLHTQLAANLDKSEFIAATDLEIH